MKNKKKSELQTAKEMAEKAINETNKKIEELGNHSNDLSDALNEIQLLFDEIRNIPTENKIKYSKLREIRLSWKQQAEKIESRFKIAVAKNAGAGGAGAAAGVGVVALGPTAAMGIATTFGIASTGTAISTLSGAAATNAALAWLGGGALAVGGGGMAAGQAFLALAGPVGWTIAGVSLLSSGVLFLKNLFDKKRIDNIFTLISKRDINKYKLAVVELNERISRILNETQLIKEAINETKTFGTNYNLMTEAQQYKLGSYVNLMSSSTQLLINPILGLKQNYSQNDFEQFIEFKKSKLDICLSESIKNLIISLSDFLYRIDLDKKDQKVLLNMLKKNKDWLKTMNIKKKELSIEVMEIVSEALKYKYSLKASK